MEKNKTTTLADRAREFFVAKNFAGINPDGIVPRLCADFAATEIATAVKDERLRIAEMIERRLPLDEGKYTTGGWRRWLDSNRELIAELRGEN